MVRYLVGMVVTSKGIFKLAMIAIRMMIVAATFPIAIIIITSLLKGSNPIQQSAAKQMEISSKLSITKYSRSHFDHLYRYIYTY
jgi:acetylglutamate synthase